VPDSVVKIAVTAEDAASPKLDAVAKSVQKVDEASAKGAKSTEALGKSFAATSKYASLLGSGVKLLAANIGPTALVGAFTAAVKSAIDLGRAMSRVSTLIPGQSALLERLGDSARRLSQAYALAATDVAAGTFQAISAGVSAGEAARFMETAAQSATAGFATMEETVSGLTTVLNAYGLRTTEAAKVSDAFFAANKLGVTTSRELGASLGQVVGVAASLNVGYEELLSATVALTKGGISTAESMTGLRAILASVLSPAEDAQVAARELGITWDATVAKTEGLTGIIDRLRIAQERGGEEMVARLVPRVEALSKAFVLISETGGRDFAATLDEITKKSGQTAEALAEVEKSASFRFDRALARIKTGATELGSVTLPALAVAADFAGQTTKQWAEGLNVLDISSRSAYENFIILNRQFTPLGATVSALMNGYESLTGRTIDLSTSTEQLREQTQALGDTLGSLFGRGVAAAASGLQELAARHDEILGRKGQLGEEAKRSADAMNVMAASATASAAAMERLRRERDLAIGQQLQLIDLEMEGLAQEQAGAAGFTPTGAGVAPEPAPDLGAIGGLGEAVKGSFDANAAPESTFGSLVEDALSLVGISFDGYIGQINEAEKANQEFAESLREIGFAMSDVAGPFASAMVTAIESVVDGEQSFASAMAGMARSFLRSIGSQATAKAAYAFAEGLFLLSQKRYDDAGLAFLSATKFGLVAGASYAASTAFAGGGGGGGRRVSAADGGSRSVAQPAAQASQQATQPVTEVFNITVQGSLVRERDLGRYVDEATRDARRSGASRS